MGIEGAPLQVGGGPTQRKAFALKIALLVQGYLAGEHGGQPQRECCTEKGSQEFSDSAIHRHISASKGQCRQPAGIGFDA
jgi:hypothetical protein